MLFEMVHRPLHNKPPVFLYCNLNIPIILACIPAVMENKGLPEIAMHCMQNGINGYSRRGNFSRSLVRSMILIYAPDSTNVYMVQQVGNLRELGWCGGLQVVKSCS